MQLIEDLVVKVPDDYLRGEIEAAVAALKQGKRFGLVFEEHITEASSLLDYPVRPGALVEARRESQTRALRRVTAVTDDGTQATVVSDDGMETSAPVEISSSLSRSAIRSTLRCARLACRMECTCRHQ